MLVHRFYGNIRSKSRDEKGLYPDAVYILCHALTPGLHMHAHKDEKNSQSWYGGDPLCWRILLAHAHAGSRRDCNPHLGVTMRG